MCIIFILQSLYRHIVNVLQRIIDCRDMQEGTSAYEGTEEALQYAREGCREGIVYTRRKKGGRGRGAGRSWYYYVIICILDDNTYYVIICTQNYVTICTEYYDIGILLLVFLIILVTMLFEMIDNKYFYNK